MVVGRVVSDLRGLTKNYLERGLVIQRHLCPPVKPRVENLDTQGQHVSARLGPTHVFDDEGVKMHRRSDLSCIDNRRDARDGTSEAPRQDGPLAEKNDHLTPT